MNSIKYFKSVVIAGLVSIAFLTGCSKDKDTKDNIAPTANITSPVDNTQFLRGQSIILNGIFEDNQELEHLDISLSSLKSTKGWNSPWEANELIELSGKMTEVSAQGLFGGVIPFDIMSGNYSIKILVVDKAYNYATYEIPISIE